MRYDEVTSMITTSSTSNWEILQSGPHYLDSFGEVSSSGQHWIEVGYHDYLAVYKADVTLRMAWGMGMEDNLTFEGWIWPDRSISRFLVDGFLQGALVARWGLLSVDGGRCYLPSPNQEYEEESPGQYRGLGWTAPTSHVALARLINNLVNRPEGEFDRYLQQTGLTETPG